MFNGPMVRWELVTLARRGHTVRARILLLYALFLAIILFAFWWFRKTSPIPYFLGTNAAPPHTEVAEFARHLVLWLLEAQLVLVALVTPAYTAAAISEEKDRQTLALLLTTSLTDREIVWSKAVARIVFVLAAVASSIPVLLFVMCLGGVDIEVVALGYALAAGTAVLSGSIGICAACKSPDTRTALINAYIQVGILFVGTVPTLPFLSPFILLLICSELASLKLFLLCGVLVPAGQTAFAAIFLIAGTRSLRKAGATGGPTPASEFPEPPRGRPEPVGIERPETQQAMEPLGTSDPILWKERHAKAQRLPVTTLIVGLSAALAMLLFVGSGWKLVKRAMQALDPDHAMMYLSSGMGAPDQANLQLLLAGLIASVLYLLPLAIGVTGCISGERLRGTLDSLLTTRLDRRRLLSAKVRVHAEHGLVFAGGAATGLGAGFGAEGGYQVATAAIAAFAGGTAFVVGAAAWLSVRCATPVRAFRLCIPVLVAVVGLPVLAWYFADWGNTRPLTTLFGCGAGVFGLVGGVMWWRASVTLERGE